MKRLSAADRYARAMGAVAAEFKQIEETGAGLSALAEVYRSVPEFRGTMMNSTLDGPSRRQILDTVLDHVQAPEALRKLLYYLLRRNRMALLPDIAARFDARMDEWLGRVEVQVTTALPLTPELGERLTQGFERLSGKTVRMKAQADSGIIGGIVVHIWGVLLDASMRTRLERLQEALLSEEKLTYGH